MFSLFSASFDDELQKISANKLMKQIQQGKLSPQSLQRAAASGGTTPERLTQLAHARLLHGALPQAP